jgi:hypothetical protein
LTALKMARVVKGGTAGMIRSREPWLAHRAEREHSLADRRVETFM